MDEDSVDGAIAAAQYFLELYPYAYNTGDLTAWRGMSHPECVFCASVVTGVGELTADGGWVEGGEITVHEISATPPELPNPNYFVEIDVREAGSIRHHGDGSNENLQGQSFPNFFVAIDFSETGWIVRGVDTDSSQ